MPDRSTDKPGPSAGAAAPRISIVVLNYNKRDDLHRNLTRLGELAWRDHEVIVVDNRSTDGSAQMVRDTFPEVDLIEAPTNGGVCKGRNLGFRRARGEFIIYLDDDSVAPKDMCEMTVRLFEQHAEAGCLAYRIRQMPQGFDSNSYEKMWLANYHGAGHAFRRVALERIDYLDENFFFGGEEIDSSLALFDYGYKTLNAPQVIVEHYSRVYHGKDLSRRLSGGVASLGWFYLKYFPLRLVTLYTARMLVSMAGTALRRRTIMPLFKGIGMYISGFWRVWKSRRVASSETIAFYTSTDVQPPHFTVPLYRKFWRLVGRRRSVVS